MESQANSPEKTVPTSVAAKKVQFADLVGRPLEFVKNITPSSSEDNLCALVGAWNSHCDINGNLPPRRLKYLSPCFIQPSKAADSFMKRVYSQNVCLENIVCENFVVTGVIRVTNLCYSKEVTVRFTLDSWKTYQDIWTDYMSTCLDGKTDKFSFRITLPPDFKANRYIEFAVCYRVWNREFWDNNDKSNYRVRCLEVVLGWTWTTVLTVPNQKPNNTGVSPVFDLQGSQNTEMTEMDSVTDSPCLYWYLGTCKKLTTNITRIHSGMIPIQLRQCELRAPLCMPEFATFVKSDVSCFTDKGQRTILLEKINRIVSQDRSVLFSEALLFRGRLTDAIGSWTVGQKGSDRKHFVHLHSNMMSSQCKHLFTCLDWN